MRTKSIRRTNYSPVRQMSRTLQDDGFPPPDGNHQLHNNNDHQTRRNTMDTPASSSSSSNEMTQHNNNNNSNNLQVPEANLEEVYICSCCGISRELKPSMRFMSTFSSLFFLFNVLVFAFGLANFGMGLWFRIDPKIYEIHNYIETQNFTIAGWLMLFCGFSACINALVGFMAVGRQAASLLACYFTVMITLTLAFVGTLVLLTVFGLGSTLEKFIIKEIHEQILRQARNSESDFNSNAAQFLDFIQVKMRCCGASDFRDYTNLGMVIPTTCKTIDKNFVSAPGCGRAIRQLLDLRAGLATGFTSASILAQLVTTILSVAMFCSIYHWRSHPRPATPLSLSGPPTRIPAGGGGIHLQSRPESPWRHVAADHQRPRSRTPIVMRGN